MSVPSLLAVIFLLYSLLQPIPPRILAYYEDNTTKSIGRKINKLDKNTNNILATYNSIADASRSLGYNKQLGNITNCCKGLRKTAYGYKWKYVE